MASGGLSRLRAHASARDAVAETHLTASRFLSPLFVDETIEASEPVASLPGVQRHTVKSALAEAMEAERLGVGGVLLFGIPTVKDAEGSGAWAGHGGVQDAARLIREQTNLLVVTDVCLCEYTDHGHCGVLAEGRSLLDEPATLERLGRTAVSHAAAGAHVVAPSAMVDGQVAAIRAALDDAGHRDVAIMSYAAKYASAFYGPFRDAARSGPGFGDRKSHQMDPRNRREALREVAADLAEGADVVMVKPAGPYLDVVRDVRERFDAPVAAYQVSGELAALEAAAANGWLDRDAVMMESLVAIQRAGADIIITYYAIDAARRLAAASGSRA